MDVRCERVRDEMTFVMKDGSAVAIEKLAKCINRIRLKAFRSTS
jgi:hypothetical protein